MSWTIQLKSDAARPFQVSVKKSTVLVALSYVPALLRTHLLVLTLDLEVKPHHPLPSTLTEPPTRWPFKCSITILTFSPRLEIPVHWRRFQICGKLRQWTGAFFCGDWREGHRSWTGAHGNVAIWHAIRSRNRRRSAGVHRHVAVLRILRGAGIKWAELTRLQKW